MSDRPIVVFGATGHIGYELRKQFTKWSGVLIPPRSDLDLSNFEDVEAYLRVSRPSLIVNAATFSDIDAAESSIQKVQRINAELPSLLANEALERKIGLVHFSTDMIFDGRGQKYPYLENAMPNPLNVFGRAMLRGESAIRSINPVHLIFRTSRVYSLRRPCFLKKLIEILKDHNDINVVSDQIASPTWARAVAEMANTAIQSSCMVTDLDNAARTSGVYHLCSIGEVSWYDFAEAVVELIDKSRAGWPLNNRPTLRAVDADLVATPARQPRYSALSTGKGEKTFGFKPTYWRDQLKDCLSGL